MITYNNIVNRFEKFVSDHLLLKTFTHGSPSGVDLEKFEVYPALHLVYTGATYENTSKEYSFEVYILDLPPDKAKKIENQQQLVSNAEQVAEDILADMMNGGNVFNFSDLYTVTNASTTPLEETTSNSLAGILLTIGIEVGYAFDACNAPLIGVNPSGSEFPVAGVSGLRIVEVDGSPDVSNVTKIIVSNGTLVDNGSGVVTLDTGGGGGAVDSVNGEVGVVVLDTDDISEGAVNEYYTEARVEANSAVVLNTAKTGITSGQAADIITNNAKVGITPTQASDITTNNAKVGITPTQASDIVTNNAKVGYTDGAVDVRIGLADLDDLADVLITSATTGEILKWNGSNWVNGTGGTGSGTLAGLTDVDVTGVVNNNTLVYDSATSKWVDGQPTTSGVVSSADFTGTKTYTIGNGSGKVDIGSFAALDFSFDFSMRGGNSFGSTDSTSAFRSTALNMGSTYRIQGIFEVTSSAVGTLFGISIANPSGYYFSQVLFVDIAPDTTTRDVTFDTGAQPIGVYEFVNTFEFGWIANANVDYKLKSFTITFTNA